MQSGVGTTTGRTPALSVILAAPHGFEPVRRGVIVTAQPAAASG